MADRKNTQSWIRSTFDKSRYELINDKYNSQLLTLLDLDNTEPSFKQINNVTAKLSIGTLIDPPICGVLDPLKTVFFVLKQSDYFLLCAPRPV